MKQVNSFRYWLVATLLLCLGMTAKAAPHSLTLKTGSDDHATITFKVNNTVVTSAEKDATVDINFAMKGNGWKVKDVKAIEYTSWDVAGARSMVPQSELKKDIIVTKDASGKYSFTMPDYNVQVEVTYETSALTDAMIQKPIKDQTWTGSPITLSTGENGDLKVMDGSTLLIAGTDYEPSYENNTDPGVNTAKVTITGKNGYAGSTASANFSIIKELKAENVSGANQTYTGSKLTTTVTVKDGSTPLIEGTDYEVSWPDDPKANTNVADGGQFTVTGKGKYKGTVNGTFVIEQRSLQDAAVSKPTTLDAMTYTGSPLTPNLDGKITYNSMTLVQGADKDYTLTYANNTNVGEATITVSGKGNYKDDITVKFNITKGASSVTKAPEAKTGLVYNGEAQTLITGGTASGGEMQYSTDGTNWSKDLPKKTDANETGYTVYYKVVGDANHSDTEPQTLNVIIEKASIDKVELTGVPKTYNGTEQSPDGVTVKAKSKDKNGNEIFITVGTADYDVKGGDKGTDADTYNYQVEAKSTSTNFKGTGEKEWAINMDNLSEGCTVELTPSTYIYGGDEKKPAVTVKKGTRTVDASEYTVGYTNNKNAGQATVTITGKNVNYTGSTSKTFTINAAPLKEVTLENNELTYNPDGSEVTITGVTAEGETGNSATKTTLTLTNTEWEVVSGKTGTNVGNYEVIVKPTTAATNYTGTAKASWKIVAKDISGVTVELTGGPWIYNGSEHKPGVIVKDGTHLLEEKKQGDATGDYTVSYNNNIEAGIETAEVIITGVEGGNYKGSKTVKFTIQKKDGEVVFVPTEKELEYNGTVQTFKLKLTPADLDLNKLQLISGNSEVAEVTNAEKGKDEEEKPCIWVTVAAKNAGVTTIYALVLGDNNYVSKWAVCEVTVKPQKIKKTDADVTVTKTPGADGVPVITVKKGTKTLVEGTDYEIQYVDADEQSKTADEMRQAPGNYTAVLTFGGNYEGIIKEDIAVTEGTVNTEAIKNLLLSGTIDPTKPVSEENKKYDINKDGYVNVADVQAQINIELGLNADGSNPDEARAAVQTATDAVLSVSTEELGGGVTRYALSLDGDREFSAFMMDITANGAMQVVGQQAAAADMTLHTGTLQNGTLRLLGIGAEQSGSVVYIDVMGEGSLNIENICFSTKSANAFYARLAGNATSIDQISAATAGGEYFGIGGQRQNELKKGVNIVRQNGKAVKVIRK